MHDLKRFSTILLLGSAALLCAAGCATESSGDGMYGDGDGDGGSGSGDTTGSGPNTAGGITVSTVSGPGPTVTTAAGVTVGVGGGSGSPTAVSLYASELPEPAPTCGENACSDDTLFLFVDSNGNSCESPYGAYDTTPQSWSFVVGLPLAYQHVGTVDLSNPDILVGTWQSIVGESNGATAGATGGLGFSGGTLEILSIDAGTVAFTAQNIVDGSDGTYSAQRCGASEPAVAGITAEDSATTTLIIGTELAVCGDALPSTCTGDDWQVAITLPSQYLVPGEYSLSDPLVTASNCADLPKFLGGSIEIVSVDDETIVAHFWDVVDHASELEQDLLVDRCAD